MAWCAVTQKQRTIERHSGSPRKVPGTRYEGRDRSPEPSLLSVQGWPPQDREWLLGFRDHDNLDTPAATTVPTLQSSSCSAVFCVAIILKCDYKVLRSSLILVSYCTLHLEREETTHTASHTGQLRAAPTTTQPRPLQGLVYCHCCHCHCHQKTTHCDSFSPFPFFCLVCISCWSRPITAQGCVLPSQPHLCHSTAQTLLELVPNCLLSILIQSQSTFFRSTSGTPPANKGKQRPHSSHTTTPQESETRATTFCISLLQNLCLSKDHLQTIPSPVEKRQPRLCSIHNSELHCTTNFQILCLLPLPRTRTSCTSTSRLHSSCASARLGTRTASSRPTNAPMKESTCSTLLYHNRPVSWMPRPLLPLRTTSGLLA